MHRDTLLSGFEKSVWKAKTVGYSELIIETVDNPGWLVKMPVPFKEGESVGQSRVVVDRSDDDWVRAMRKHREWHAAGGPRNLGELLATFVSWVEHGELPVLQREWLLASDVVTLCTEDATVLTLQDWYAFHCDEFWEHEFGITIRLDEDDCWVVLIDLCNTIAEEVPFEPAEAALPGDEHYRCWVEDCVFRGHGTKFTLEAMCRVFCEWVRPLLAEACKE